jgi:hypothetical protein
VEFISRSAYRFFAESTQIDDPRDHRCNDTIREIAEISLMTLFRGAFDVPKRRFAA